MWNPFRRKTNHEPAMPEPEMPPDDWKPGHDQWREICICHCGHTREPNTESNVCPICGHKDKWRKVVARLTYEFSSSRNWRYGHLFHYDTPKRFRPDHRNVKWEEWTPEHCEVKDEEG